MWTDTYVNVFFQNINTQQHTTTTTTHNNTQQHTTTHNNNKAYDSSTRFLVCVTVMIPNPADGFCADRAHVGSARRRRERRLRSFLRHERMTVRMELAAALHHSRDVGSGKNDGLRAQKTVNSREDAVFFELYDEDTAGWRPPCLGEPPVPQARVQRHTVEQIIDTALGLPKLDVPVPLMVTRFRLLPSRLSTCPRSSSRKSRCEPWFASRRWWSSWWKCRRQPRAEKKYWAPRRWLTSCGVVGLPLAYAAQVPAIQGVREHGDAQGSVHRQIGGSSCY